MSFQIETSTRPAAIGAGAPPAKFVDYTHKLRLENAVTGETADALATFGDGPELVELRQWAERAHGLDIVAIETFDAKAEQKRRKALADDQAAELAEAQSEAQRIEAGARIEAARILADARAEADDLIAEASRILADARDQAADIVADVEAAERWTAGEEADAAAPGEESGEAAGEDPPGEDEPGKSGKRGRK